MAGSGLGAISEGREWLVGPRRGPGVVRMPSQRAGSGLEDLSEGR